MLKEIFLEEKKTQVYMTWDGFFTSSVKHKARVAGFQDVFVILIDLKVD